MADIEHLKQDFPGPVCHPTNIFSGAVVAASDGANANAAKRSAERRARRARNTAIDAARNLRNSCPNSCKDGANSNVSPRKSGHIVTVQVGGNNPAFVSYYFGRWKVRVECPTSNKVYRNQPDTQDFKTVRHATALVCPGTRTLSGVAMAYAIRSSKAEAENAAKALAEQKAKVGKNADKRKQCPPNAAGKRCQSTVIAEAVSPGVKLHAVHEIKQAKQGSVKRYVAYYAAHWTVEIRCAPPPKKKKGKKGRKKLRDESRR